MPTCSKTTNQKHLLNGSRQQKLNLPKGPEDTLCKSLFTKPNPIMESHPNDSTDTGTTCTPMTEPYDPPVYTYVRRAYTEEENKDDKDDNVSSLAACMAQLSEDQCKQWVQEMNDMGINF